MARAYMRGARDARPRARLLQPGLRIDRRAALADLEVKDGTLERAGVARSADHLTGLNLLPDAHRDARQVRVQRVVTAAVVQDHHLSVGLVVLAGVVHAAPG